MRPRQYARHHGTSVKVSILVSIYNAPGNERGKLLTWGLRYLETQSLPPEQWELILIDDMSDSDITPFFAPWIDHFNIVHIKMDHTRHPIWQEMNSQGFTTTEKENWPHTPALSTNLGAKAARGKVLCFSQPEILPDPQALLRGFRQTYRQKRFVFSNLILTPPNFRAKFLQRKILTPYPDLWNQALNSLKGKDKVRYKSFHPGENYWMFAFLDRQWFIQVNGVDEEFLRGVYAEDDNFRERTVLRGIQTVRDHNMFAVHLNHEHETHKKQLRDRPPWTEWEKVNRGRMAQFRAHPQAFGGYRANVGKHWGPPECVREILRYPLKETP